ncbi:MAG: hypothetical protein IT240_01635 [Bacteroidia bacterium]|nr:hypothetical protein [Bacteroidia bacterium]MCC6767719.1 hypothetical protein [Bacteroidia bacterium]
MTITDFRNNYRMYDNMSIWEIKSIDDLFKAHESMQEIFEKEYKDSYAALQEKGSFNEPLSMTVSKLLDYFNDKQFFVFSYNDKHHNDLKALQDEKIIHFGIDIHVIHPTSVYVLEMDKTKDLRMYDN